MVENAGMSEMIGKEFQITWDGQSIIYNPMLGSVTDTSSGQTIRIDKNPNSQFSEFSAYSADLLREKYKPFCLTIYPDHRCNLACEYCYVFNKETLPNQNINLAAVRTAANIVARNCAELSRPFILGFHGGNEPLFNLRTIKRCLEICGKVTESYGLELLPFCTTNGILSERTAKWAAKTFHSITLSWDGPADVHDRYRVKLNGTPTSSIVGRTAAIMLKSCNDPQQFRVRSTVTRESVDRLLEIVQYFHEQEIRWLEFYPVFQDSNNSVHDFAPSTTKFVSNFLKAQNWGKKHDITVGYAGSRLADFHDKYCLVLQNNLTLTPDGYLTTCFLRTHNHRNQNHRFVYGHFDQERGKLIIDWWKLEQILGNLSGPYSQCEHCFNYLHCAKVCPTICPLQPDSSRFDQIGCTIERWIGLANILGAAGYEVQGKVLDNCNPFFSSINVELIPEREEYARI